MAKVKKDILETLSGSTSFKMNSAVVVLRKISTKFFTELLNDLKKDIEAGKVYRMTQGKSAIVIICEEPFGRELKKKYGANVVFFEDDLVAFTIMSPKKAIATPGILSYVLNRLAKEKVNVIQLITTYTDITLLIKRTDFFKVMDFFGLFEK